MGFMTKDPRVRLDDTVDYIAGRRPPNLVNPEACRK